MMRHLLKLKEELNRFEFSFSFLKLVAIPRLKSSLCPTILLIAGKRIFGYIPMVISAI